METRAKDLKDFTMWNSSNSGIKFLDLDDTILSQGLLFDRDLAIASSKIQWKRLSKFNHKFAMPFFYDQVRMDLTTDVEQSVSSYNPFIAVPFKKVVSGLFNSCGACAFKRLLHPIKQAKIGVRNLQNTSIMAIFVAIVRFVFKFAGMETSFTVNNPSEISQLKRIMNFRFIKNSVFVVNVIEFHRLQLVRVH